MFDEKDKIGNMLLYIGYRDGKERKRKRKYIYNNVWKVFLFMDGIFLGFFFGRLL